MNSRATLLRMSDHVKGLLITTLGVLFVTPDSLFVRVIGGDAITVSFFRGLTSGLIVFLGTLAILGVKGFRDVAATGWRGALYAILLGLSGPAFVLAVTLTSIANVVFIIATMPVFASVFSRIFLKEPISTRMSLTMFATMIGLAVIAWGSTESTDANWRGDLAALFVSVCYAALMTVARRLKAVSMVPAIPVAYLAGAFCLWPFATPADVIPAQLGWVLAHGAFIAVSTCLLALGPRYITSAEVALLILLESVLAPILAWALLGENPGIWAVIGGTIVIGALILSNLVALRRQIKTRPQPPANSAI